MSEPAPQTDDTRYRIVDIALDHETVAYRNADVEHERKVAIFDLIESNYFRPIGRDDGPFKLALGLQDGRLAFTLEPQGEGAGDPHTFLLSLSKLRRVIKDYFAICDSYYAAIKNAPPSQIEAIDMGRRGLHNEGSQVLLERLEGKVETDFDTARRLFTLICVLHWKG